jgi:hypothetical protein
LPEAHLRRAEANLTRAIEHFQALRRAAFAGDYDPDEFDEAVLACRAAETELLAARHTFGRHPTRTASARPALDPLARLRFARWLVQTGRLSEQIAPDEPAGAPAEGSADAPGAGTDRPAAA